MKVFIFFFFYGGLDLEVACHMSEVLKGLGVLGKFSEVFDCIFKSDGSFS